MTHAERGALGGKANKGTRKSKLKDWDELGTFITEYGARRIAKLLRNSDDKEFFERYTKLLMYFKPKQTSAMIQSDSVININLVNDDGLDIMDKI